MKLHGENRTEKRQLRSADVLHQPEEKTRHSPSELLTPEVRRKILEIKQGYEGGMIGDRIPPYLSFLASARRCWPELKDELVIANPFLADAGNRIPDSMKNLLDQGVGDRTMVAYASGMAHLFEMAFIQPTLLRELKEYQHNLLLLLQSELRMGHYAYVFRFASILCLGLPESKPLVNKVLEPHSSEIAEFVLKRKTWRTGALAKLLIPGFTLDIPAEEQERLTQENKRELERLVQQPNSGETSELDARLDRIFAIGVLLADEATLQPDGTIRYVYSKKPDQRPPLPTRPEV